MALWATCGPPEVRAEAGVAGGCGEVTRLSLWAHLCFLPSARGAADAHNSQPMPWHDAVPCACEAVACEQPFGDASLGMGEGSA
jgi:hypothetical protein